MPRTNKDTQKITLRNNLKFKFSKIKKITLLKVIIKIKHNVYISEFNKLVSLFDNYKPRKSKTSTRDEVNKFLQEAEVGNVFIDEEQYKFLFCVISFY